MGNEQSSSSSSSRRKSGPLPGGEAVERVKKVVGEVQEEIKKSVKKFDEDHPAAQFLDTVCGGGGYFDDVASQNSSAAGGAGASGRNNRKKQQYYSGDDYNEESDREDDSRTAFSEDDTTAYTDDRSRQRERRGGGDDKNSVESQSYMSQSEYDSDQRLKKRGGGERGRKSNSSFDTEEDTRTDASSTAPNNTHAATAAAAALAKQPLASSFAKRCYFTKAGIGRTTQHYEGLTLTGNVVLMLASAMKLKGCPTICDEDLRRVEQTYPNQFSRLPDELLLSSGWRRISKYCHFSNKAIPDGVPFFHSKQRLHPSGGYYFLLASAVGMTRPMDVEPLTRDTLVLLETDYPSQCDSAPSVLTKDHEQWTLVNKFCFFSGGPINTEEDVYYQADFDGNPIFMLAFLSPSLTPEELYKLNEANGEHLTLKSIHNVQEVESVYDLTERDFDDLKLYHLGPCRALPQYILQPQAWIKILPPHFLAARQRAMIRAEDYMQQQHQRTRHHYPGGMPADFASQADPHHHYYEDPSQPPQINRVYPDPQTPQVLLPNNSGHPRHYFDEEDESALSPGMAAEFQRAIEEEGAFHDDSIPLDERVYPVTQNHGDAEEMIMASNYPDPRTPKLDPPDDEPPSLHKASIELLGRASVEDPYSTTANPRRGNAHTSNDGPLSPDDEEQLSANLISLGTPDDQPNPPYDPFTERNVVDFSQDEFGGYTSSTAYQLTSFQQQQQQHQHQGDQQQQEERTSRHYRPPPAVRSLDPLYTAGRSSPTHHDHNDYGDEEKKMGMEEQNDKMETHQKQQQQSLYHSFKYDMDSGLKSGEEDFIPIQREGYRLNGNAAAAAAAVATSPNSVSTEQSHQSAAFRGAQELLRKNRRRRQEQGTPKEGPSDPPEFGSEEVVQIPMGQVETGTWEEGSDFTGSNVSGSSLWSDASGSAGDRSSRRALILQMAKARMKSNGGSPNKTNMGPSNQKNGFEPPQSRIEEEAISLGGLTEGNADIDLTEDLD